MNGKWIVRFYPKSWHKRYEDEFLAMLEQMPFSISNILNIFTGIIDAYIFSDVTLNQLSGIERVKYMLGKLRSYYGKGIILFLLFVTPAFLFNAMLDDSPILPVMCSTDVFNLAYNGFMIGVAIALIAISIGGFLVLFSIFKWSILQKRRDILVLFIVPVIAFLVIVAFVLYINITLENTIPGWTRGNINQCLMVFLLLITGACVYQIIQKGQLKNQKISLFGRKIEPYKISMHAATVVAIGMEISTLSLIVWGILANKFVSSIMRSSNLGIFHANTLLLYLVATLIMLVTSCISGFVAKRGAKYIAE